MTDISDTDTFGTPCWDKEDNKLTLTHQTLNTHVHAVGTKVTMYLVLTHQTQTEIWCIIVKVQIHLTHQTLTKKVT